jgi:hypothetical protein
MRSLAAAFLLLLCLPAAAADREYAVLSLVGDRLLISQQSAVTGSRLDRNQRQTVPVPSDTFDRTVLRLVKERIEEADARAKVHRLLVNDAKLRAAADAAVEPGAIVSVVPILKPMLKDVTATHWLLVTRHKAEARAQLEDGTVGSGTLDGLGFFVDRQRELQDIQTGHRSIGFVAPFAYLHFALIDAATGALVRESFATESLTVGNQTATHAWDALTPEDKVRYLEHLLDKAVGTQVPKLVAP